MEALDLAAAKAVRDGLLARWGEVQGVAPGPARFNFAASLDAADEPPPPPPGLAVGFAADDGARTVIGVRITARGKRLKAARALLADLQAKGLPVDARVIPQPSIRPEGHLDAAGLQAQFSGHFRPLHLGCSVSHENGPAGTLGGFVNLAGKVAILSCSHVLALAGAASVGDHVCQPAHQDQAVVLAENRIGALSAKFAPLIARRPNNLDAAVAYLHDAAGAPLGNCIPQVQIEGERAIPAALQGLPLGRMAGVGEVARGTRVAKVGRSSGYTEGVLNLARLTNFTPDLIRNGVRDTYPFPDVIEVESLAEAQPFARGGDSGSLVFTLPDRRPIGIHFCSLPIAGGPSLNYLMPLDRICAMFGVEVA